MKYLVVLSGGQDSTTCLFWAKQKASELHAITFDYGQRHALEINAAREVALMAGVDSHEIIDVPGCLKSTSPLLSKAALERYENAEHMEQVIGDRVELTFVPMRNTLFLTIAANRALALGCEKIVTGVCQEDNANYPDCRERYINAMELAINESLGGHCVEIVTPLMHFNKAQTVKLAHDLGQVAWSALAYSHTSYDGKYPPTDMNHANVLRAKGFEDADLPDPLVLRAWRAKLMPLPPTNNYRAYRINI